MAKHKIDIEKFSNAAERISALAHPVRIAIIGLLDYKSMNVTSILKSLQIDQPNASHHLKILKDYGIVSSRRDGRDMYYTLKQNSLMHILNCADSLQ
ncbi:MAG: metalloregulator ArsR/SmtB family transcription factor [Saprospiraceae bacterium]|nr:metalloregulator ArsR/SmtB family transcription factor [Saprospiraceae bacterium]